MSNKNLLLFFSDENVSSCPAVIPTLTWMAEKAGVDFESYICTTPPSYGGRMLPFMGNMHMQQFLYMANFYDKILYCAITSREGYQFRREVLAFGGEVISCRKNGELAEFYQDLFAYFKLDIPARATIMPNETEAFHLAPYCYPEVLFTQTLGLSEQEWDPEKYAKLGVKEAASLYCKPETGSLPLTVIDDIQPEDTYGKVTERIVKRWIDQADSIGFTNPEGITRWSAMFCRKKILCLYQPTDWKPYMETVAHYARITGDDVVTGNQMVIPMTDDVCSELSRHGLMMDLVGVDPRIGFTLQRQLPMPLDWLKDARAPWEDEYSDEYLLQKIEEHAIPVCFLFYAADLGHIAGLPRILDLMGIEGMRAGLAFPSTWYEYAPEMLEQLYISRELGGVFPQVEPMISSGGISVVTEAKGYLPPDLYTDMLNRARKQIAELAGEKMVPIGYYPFQDCDPYYGKVGRCEPQYQCVADAGFDYYVSYVDSYQRGKILAQVDQMTVVNQQTKKWFPGGGISMELLKEWEAAIPANETDWIFICYDSPFFATTPTYMTCKDTGWLSDQEHRFGMKTIMEPMQYVRRGGGDSGRLFMLKPHELVRYARLLRERGLK